MKSHKTMKMRYSNIRSRQKQNEIFTYGMSWTIIDLTCKSSVCTSIFESFDSWFADDGWILNTVDDRLWNCLSSSLSSNICRLGFDIRRLVDWLLNELLLEFKRIYWLSRDNDDARRVFSDCNALISDCRTAISR